MKKMVVDEDLSQTTFVVLDLETSGASPNLAAPSRKSVQSKFVVVKC